MKKIFIDALAVTTLMFLLILFKYFNGFENTLCFVSAMILVEIWKDK